MKAANLFNRVENTVSQLKELDIHFADSIYVISKPQFDEMNRISDIFLKLIKRLYKANIYWNSELGLVSHIKNLPALNISFSPMRLDFLQKNDKTLVLSDVNLPGSFVPDLFWPAFGIGSSNEEIRILGSNFKVFNAFSYYSENLNDTLGYSPRIIRFLEKHTVKTKKQLNFLENLYKYIKDSSLDLDFRNKEVTYSILSDLSSEEIISVFLNTHNSPDNLISSFKTICDFKNPIFANPQLLPYTDKKPPSYDFLKTYLSKHDANYLYNHLPQLSSEEDYIKKRRFGHSSSSLSSEHGSYFDYPEVKLEKLYPLNYQNIEAPLFKEENKRNSKYKNYLFEISLNSFIITKKNEVHNYCSAVSISSRGNPTHPISGPHTTLFPTILSME